MPLWNYLWFRACNTTSRAGMPWVRLFWRKSLYVGMLVGNVARAAFTFLRRTKAALTTKTKREAIISQKSATMARQHPMNRPGYVPPPPPETANNDDPDDDGSYSSDSSVGSEQKRKEEERKGKFHKQHFRTSTTTSTRKSTQSHVAAVPGSTQQKRKRREKQRRRKYYPFLCLITRFLCLFTHYFA